MKEEINEHLKQQQIQISSKIIAHSDPRSPITEAYRTLRTNLNYINKDKNLKTILVTSCRPEEGKTLTAVNLAITLAEIGNNVLLVDTDMRRPAVHSMLNINKDPGLSDVLRGNYSWDKALVRTGIDNLTVLPAGHIPKNPSELIGTEKMKDLLKEQSNFFDIIFLDSASVLTVTDASILSTMVDGILLVILADKTPRDAAMRTLSLLRKIDAYVVGIVFNAVDVTREGYYYYYYSSDKKGAMKK
ncbi:MAG: CpsD/CapB family tyrosine-protein kinase [Candidatus Ancaeobacter aquaticus]|nr:CpsD/CapB family tyrosine-protein kinase [Candidatus Ancaeobacter aquaticus]